MFKDCAGVSNQLFLFLGRNRCTTRPQTALFLRSFLPVLLYSYLGISPLRPKQCLHKLSQSSWENNRTHCIHQLYSTHATLTQLDQNFHLCTSPLMTDSVTVHIWKRKECLQNRLHSVAFFSHPQRSL